LKGVTLPSKKEFKNVKNRHDRLAAEFEKINHRFDLIDGRLISFERQLDAL
jgi:hypothetical protein